VVQNLPVLKHGGQFPLIHFNAIPAKDQRTSRL